MKQIYIPRWVSFLIIVAVAIGATMFILHVIAEMNLEQLQAAQQEGL